MDVSQFRRCSLWTVRLGEKKTPEEYLSEFPGWGMRILPASETVLRSIPFSQELRTTKLVTTTPDSIGVRHGYKLDELLSRVQELGRFIESEEFFALCCQYHQQNFHGGLVCVMEPIMSLPDYGRVLGLGDIYGGKDNNQRIASVIGAGNCAQLKALDAQDDTILFALK